MSFREMSQACRRHPAWVTLPALVCMLAGLAFGATRPHAYQATARVFFNVSAGNSATDLNQASTYLDREMSSYEEVLTTPLVLQPVIDQLNLNISPEDLSPRVTTASQAGSTMLDVSATSSSADEAARLANTIAQQMTKVTEQVSPSPKGGARAVNATVVQTASVPTMPLGMSTVVLAAVGLVVGLFIGIVLALLSTRLSRRIRAAGEISGSINIPILAISSTVPQATAIVDICDDLLAHWRVTAVTPRVILIASVANSGGVTEPISLALSSRLIDMGHGVRCFRQHQMVAALPDGIGIRRANTLPHRGEVSDDADILQILESRPNDEVWIIEVGDLCLSARARLLASYADAAVLTFRLGTATRSQVVDSVATARELVSGEIMGVFVPASPSSATQE